MLWVFLVFYLLFLSIVSFFCLYLSNFCMIYLLNCLFIVFKVKRYFLKIMLYAFLCVNVCLVLWVIIIGEIGACRLLVLSRVCV